MVATHLTNAKGLRGPNARPEGTAKGPRQGHEQACECRPIVGEARFELAASWPQTRRANQAALLPGERGDATRKGFPGPPRNLTMGHQGCELAAELPAIAAYGQVKRHVTERGERVTER